ncbi:MAG: TraA family conjugative transfer protein [Pseudomonas sp.]|nr:TraA family conjugative transfer protein [Pseudomonas sp.]
MQLSKTTLNTLALAVAMMIAGTALAGTGGDTFDSVWITLTDWMQGTLGRILIGLMILTGIGAGVLRQSLMPFVTGVGGGVGLYAAPDVIESIMTATVPAAAAVYEVLNALPVGM